MGGLALSPENYHQFYKEVLDYKKNGQGPAVIISMPSKHHLIKEIDKNPELQKQGILSILEKDAEMYVLPDPSSIKEARIFREPRIKHHQTYLITDERINDKDQREKVSDKNQDSKSIFLPSMDANKVIHIIYTEGPFIIHRYAKEIDLYLNPNKRIITYSPSNKNALVSTTTNLIKKLPFQENIEKNYYLWPLTEHGINIDVNKANGEDIRSILNYLWILTVNNLFPSQEPKAAINFY